MAESGGGKKWFRYSCMGCIGVILFIVLIAVTFSGLAMLKLKGETVEDVALSPDLPLPELSEPVVQTEPPAEGSTDVTEPIELDTTLPGKVILELRQSGFTVEPARPGEPLRVEARFDTTSYELVEDLQGAGEPGWTYHLTFRRKGSGFVTGLKELFGGTTPEVAVYLPTDIPIELELRVEQGGAEVELGGLWLTAAELVVSQGGFELDFSEPLREPLTRLSIEGSMGGMDVGGVGNASPAELEVDFSMGGMNLDLRGAWRQDAEIDIRASMGGGMVRLPDDVHIEGLDTGSVRVEEEPEIPRPTLRFSASSQMGELEFH